MIPIKWDGSKWIKANTDNLIGSNEWYSYNNFQWANAALVTSSTRDEYVDALAGTEVPESDIMAYFVWIPRFKYELFNVSSADMTPRKINVVFENKTTPKSTGSTNGTYLTHPAFTFGTKEVNGIWVAKFETTGNMLAPTIKPNLSSQRSQSVREQFEISRLFQNETTYGLTATNDPHMMKNTEWGAMAYLSQSDYGKYSNPVYTGATGLEKEIWMNPNSHLTGCAGNSYSETVTLECNSYQTPNGVKASTTGNVYGIYDTVGGGWEYVMAAQYNSASNTNIQIASSGFVQTTIDSADMSKYINKYNHGTTFNDSLAYARKILGDATGETKGWTGYANFPYSISPWSLRGGLAGSTGNSFGMFCFINGSGAARGDATFRVVIFGE
jgi:hypothetical protein